MSDEPEETTPAPEESSPEDSGSAPEKESTPASEAPETDSGSPDDLTTATEDTAAPAPSGGPVAIGQGKMSESDDKTFGMLAHLLGALFSFIGPLIIWLIKREESPFVDDQGKEALNFQITICIGYVVSTAVGLIPFIGCIAPLVLAAVWLIGLIFGILGCVEANKGNVYRYPFSLRLVT